MCKGVMQSIGLAPRIPAMEPAPPPPEAPPAPPPVPTQMTAGSSAPAPSESPAAQAAGDAERRLAARQRGRATTILTGAQGLVGVEAIGRPTATKVLLGG